MEEDSEITAEDHGIIIRKVLPADVKYVYAILEEMERSAKARGTGIARRTPQSLCKKIYEGKAVIALTPGGCGAGANATDEALPVARAKSWVGFSYIEVWSGGEFISNSGLIVAPAYRGLGVAKAIKKQVFLLARSRYPEGKIFSITTGAAVMKMNHELGFEPVTYECIARDEDFWSQCKACVNYPILQSRDRKNCLCTAMMYDFSKEKQENKTCNYY